MGKNVTTAQVMEIKKMADEKGIDRESFGRLYGEFARVLDGATAPDDIIAAIEAGRTAQWRHPDQMNGFVRGYQTKQRLIDAGLIASCVDLDDLVAVQARGIVFFERHFAGKVVCAWRSVRNGYVPCLAVVFVTEQPSMRNMLALYWDWVDSDYFDTRPHVALRLLSK